MNGVNIVGYKMLGLKGFKFFMWEGGFIQDNQQ